MAKTAISTTLAPLDASAAGTSGAHGRVVAEAAGQEERRQHAGGVDDAGGEVVAVVVPRLLVARGRGPGGLSRKASRRRKPAATAGHPAEAEQHRPEPRAPAPVGASSRHSSAAKTTVHVPRVTKPVIIETGCSASRAASPLMCSSATG